MPTLIRLIIILLFLAGLVYAGMFALVAYVEPTPKQQTIRIPQRDLLGGGAARLARHHARPPRSRPNLRRDERLPPYRRLP